MDEITIANITIPLDRSYRHEQNYFLRYTQNKRSPQIDIDNLIFAHVIRPGDVVLDAGANIGVTALEMIAAGAKRVHAFEPVPELYDRLSRLPIQAYSYALCNFDGDVELTISKSHNQGSSLSQKMVDKFNKVYTDSPEKMVVTARKFDSCGIEDVDVMKIDIEGAEADFFKGAALSLAKHLPRAVVIEIYDWFFKETKFETDRYYKNCYRCLISKSDYALKLVRHDVAFDASHYHSTAPMYIFTNETY